MNKEQVLKMIALLIINATNKAPIFSVSKLNSEGEKTMLKLGSRLCQLNQMKTFWFSGI